MPIPYPGKDVVDLTVRLTIKSDGAQIPDTYPVVSINTFYELNRIPYAEIVLIDGSVESADFLISESDKFVPGAAIVISAGYDGTEDVIFSGLVVKQSVRINSSKGFNLVVTCKHNLVKLTYNKKEQFFLAKKDSDILSEILGEYGLSPTVDSTSISHEGLFQKMATDWDFVLSRAEFCGYIISISDTAIKIGKPAFSATAALKVEFGHTMISFDAELSAEKQASGLKASAWDSASLAAISSSASEPTLSSHGNLSPSTLPAKLSQKILSLTAGTPMTADELKSWADSQLLRMRMSALMGSVSFVGYAKIFPGDIIQLAGVGDRFNGNAIVARVEHSIEDGSWHTTVGFGLDDKPISQMPDFSYPDAFGLVPAINGLQVGTVKKLSQDPLSQFRIQVEMSANTTSPVTMWARISNFYATSTTGISFLPEVGDEVLLGFLESNPSHPVILGSLYSSKNASAYTAADENNYIKAIATKSKLKITFDDQKKIVKIITPGGNSITLDDEGKSVEIVDQNKNSLKMTSSGINLESAKNITIKATGSITLDATGKLDLGSKQDVGVEGMNVKIAAKMALSAKGTATAELSASGQTVVKGAMVMIN